MKNRIFAFILVSGIAVFVFIHQVYGQSGFIINNADAVVYVDPTGSPDLEILISNVVPRFLVKYANAMKYLIIAPVPSELQNLIGQVEDRFIFRHANANRYYQLNYPVNLIGDTDPPSILNLSLSNNWVVTWDTDEYATGELFWGEQSGTYTHTISNTQYTKSHEFQMFDLTPGATYYYKVQSEDRSHNPGQSQENTFIVEAAITGLTAINDGPTILGNQTTFTATVTAGTNVIYNWSFGDGTTGSGQIVTHVYPYVHNYTAQVMATNSVSIEVAQTTVTIYKPTTGYRLYIPISLR